MLLPFNTSEEFYPVLGNKITIVAIFMNHYKLIINQ